MSSPPPLRWDAETTSRLATKLSAAFDDGSIWSASRRDVELYNLLLARTHAIDHFGTQAFPQYTETLRLLLKVRLAEEGEQKSLAIATDSVHWARRAFYAACTGIALTAILWLLEHFGKR